MKLISILIALLCLSSCEHSFHPINKNHNLNFSIYAVLDLSADTQWVRVMPIRDSILTRPEPIDATVTLTRLSTGETEILEDSLFQTAQGKYVWNYWTNTPLIPEETYTIRAEASDGSFSRGTGFVPNNFPDPVISFNDRYQTFSITIDSAVERLVVAEIVYGFRIAYDTDCGDFPYNPVNHLKDVTQKPDGSYVLFADELAAFAEAFSVETSKIHMYGDHVTIVSGGPNWPDSLYHSSDGTINNIENGLGYVTGAVIKKIPILTEIPDGCR